MADRLRDAVRALLAQLPAEPNTSTMGAARHDKPAYLRRLTVKSVDELRAAIDAEPEESESVPQACEGPRVDGKCGYRYDGKALIDIEGAIARARAERDRLREALVERTAERDEVLRMLGLTLEEYRSLAPDDSDD